MLLNLWCPMTSKWGMTQLPPFILFLFCFPSDPSFLLLLPLPSGVRCPSWIKARFGLKSLRNIGIVMGEKEANFTVRMVNGFCKLRNALSASKVRDFKRLPLSQLFLHNLTSERKVLQSLSVTVGRCYWWFFLFLFFLRFPEKLTVSLWLSFILQMMKCVATRLDDHLKTDISYNLFQTEVLHHIYNAKLEGFMEGRNTY